jgi:hypothetical protein
MLKNSFRSFRALPSDERNASNTGDTTIPERWRYGNGTKQYPKFDEKADLFATIVSGVAAAYLMYRRGESLGTIARQAITNPVGSLVSEDLRLRHSFERGDKLRDLLPLPFCTIL